MYFLRYYLWIAPHILILPVLVLTLRRGLHKIVPLFVVYLVFETLEFVALFLIHILRYSSQHYQRLFILGMGISSVVKLALVYQLSGQFLINKPTVVRPLRSALHLVFSALLLLAAGSSAMLPEAGLEHLRYIFHVADFSSNIVFAGLLLTLLAFARLLSLPWRSYLFGIALGFGIFAASALIGASLRAALGPPASIGIDNVEMVAYHVCVVIWLVYLMRAQSAGITGGGLTQSELEQWNQELERLGPL
jgi:hypothetical protein